MCGPLGLPYVAASELSAGLALQCELATKLTAVWTKGDPLWGLTSGPLLSLVADLRACGSAAQHPQGQACTLSRPAKNYTSSSKLLVIRRGLGGGEH
ncbi:hypothetical protein AOLI_G00021820 [Acnodon oligacanthus]